MSDENAEQDPREQLPLKKRYGRIRGCERCGRLRGLTTRYGLHLCRQCFREIAPEIGFKKYS